MEEDNRKIPQQTVVFPQQKKKTKTGLLIFIGILIAFVLLIILVTTSEGGNTAEMPMEPYIANLYVEGSISGDSVDSFGTRSAYQHLWTLNQIDKLIADENNKGMILSIDSPGGGVYESDELYLKVKEYKKKTERPVYTYMASMAASGGYYIATPSNQIFANRNTWTGSIGVTIGTFFDFSEFLEDYGIKSKTIASGENKVMGSNWNAMTKEQENILQSLVDEAYQQFVGIVSEEREIPMEETLKLADGRIYTAKQALELKLIDQIGSFEDAYFDMQQEYELWNCELYDVAYYEEPSSFDWLFRLLGEGNFREESDIKSLVTLTERRGKFPVSYLCEWMQ